MRLSQAICDYMEYIEVTRSKGTYDYYKYYVKVLDDYLGSIDCDLINNKVILNFIVKQRKRNPDISNATINKFIGTLKSILKYSCDIDLKFSKLKEQKKIISTISKETTNMIFNHYQKHLNNKYQFRNYVFIRLLLDTGLRLSEIINIKVSDIDFATRSIHVRVTKTDVDRYVCFTESTKRLLNKFVALHRISGLLFFDFKSKKPLTTSSVESFIFRLKNRLHISENITPHKWRHTFATNFLRNGGDLETLRLLLGHSNLRTTQKYLHLSKHDIVSNYNDAMQ